MQNLKKEDFHMVLTKDCLYCGTPTEEGDDFCDNGCKRAYKDGPIEPHIEKTCGYCGTPIEEGDDFCDNGCKRAYKDGQDY